MDDPILPSPPDQDSAATATITTSPVTTTAPTRPPERNASARSPLLWVVSVALAAIVGALLFMGGYLAAGGAGSATCAAPNESFAAFCEAYDDLQRQYVDQLDDAKLAEGAIQGMFEYGVRDPFSGYMSPDAYRSALDDLSGRLSGIGAEIGVRNVADPGNLADCATLSPSCALVIIAPLPDSPAQAAGLRAGDVVLSVDGESVVGSTLAEQIARVRGEAGTDVVLSVQRGSDTFDLTITRAEIKIPEVTSRMLDDGTGYIALHGFSANAADEFHDALASLLDQKASGIVFDLRDNPGGYIDAAQRIASEFIGDGLLFVQESADDNVKRWEATGDGVATAADLPVVLLVNGGSASASEIVAAALKERSRATLVGQPTFGKNTVQLWDDLPNGGGVRITISRWFTPGHNSVAPDGVQPDIVVDVPDGTAPERDLFLERAQELLRDLSTGSAPGTRRIGLRAHPAFDPASHPFSYDARGATTAIA